MTPTFGYRGKACLSFLYHMYGNHIGKLEVFTKDGESSTTRWTEKDSKGIMWHSAQIDLDLETNSAVSIP